MEYGIVYLLTNPAMPGLVKIGMTTQKDIKVRMNELYTTGVPLPFECQYACKVKKADCAKVEKALHKAFEPNRVNNSREFFTIKVEQAKAILELFHHDDATIEVSNAIGDGLSKDDIEAQKKAKKHRPSLNFIEMGLKVGDELSYKNDPNKKVFVQTQRSVMCNGSEMSLTAATREFSGITISLNPCNFWFYNDTILADIYDKTYQLED